LSHIHHKEVNVLHSRRNGSICALGLALGLVMTNPALTEEKRPFEVHDSIEMAYFGTLNASRPLELDDDGIVSPDTRWVVKVTHRGILPEGVTEGTIWLFDAVALRRSVNDKTAKIPTPTALVRVSAGVNGIDFVADRGRTISEVRWSKDSRSVTFLGRDGRENRRLYIIDLQTQKLAALSLETQDVVGYTTSSKGFFYLAAADRHEDQEWHSTGPGIPDIQAGTGLSLIHLLYPNFLGDGCCKPLKFSLWQVTNDRAAPVVEAASKNPVEMFSHYGAQLLSLSPDETRLVTIAYDEPEARPESLLKYRVIDLGNGAVRNLLDTPAAPNEDGYDGRYRAVWSSDSQYLALTVLGRVGAPAQKDDSPISCAVLVFDLSTLRTDCAMPPREAVQGALYTVYWSSPGDKLRIRYRKPYASLYDDEVVERKHGIWKAVAKDLPPLDLPLQMTVTEGLNDPPVLLATDPKTLKSRVVFDPNPQLKDMQLVNVSVFEWKDTHGRTMKGGLAKPVGYVSGRRYPLVIQTHGFDPKKFFRMGYGETANAGRALTSRDIVVLQVGEPFEPYWRTWEAARENGTNVYLAAIDQLAAQGLIDPKKVGLTGYSATGLFVSNALTRAPDRFAAAALSNTDPGSLTDYYTYIDYLRPDYARGDARVVADAKPYGEGLKLWMERAPDFSTDKITAAILLSPATPHDLITEWSLYAQLRDQGKPVDLLYMRSGQHNLAKPLQRFAQQEMIVDWFDFWLNGHENATPAKASQYVRWEKLRAASNAQKMSQLTR
jgi:dipeptidyl aminopeptidase/acylaminoacyl peptidase